MDSNFNTAYDATHDLVNATDNLTRNHFMFTKYRSRMEEFFCFFALSVLSGAYVDFPMPKRSISSGMGQNNPYNAGSMLVVLAGVIAFGWPLRQRILAIARQAWPATALVIFAAVTALWSFDALVTLRRTTTLMIAVSFGYFLIARFSMEGIIRRLTVVSLVITIASIFAALFVPSLGVMSDGELAGRWSGVFPHKQQLGAAMFIGALCAGWLGANSKGWTRIGCAAMFLLCLFVIGMARSQTAMLSVVAIPLVILAARITRLPGLTRIWALYGLAVIVTVIAVLLAIWLEDFMTFLGRDVSLTGRAPLWDLLIGIAARRPLNGYGYGAFWVSENPITLYVNAVSGWYVPEAHNGFLDLQLQTGLPGLLLAILIIAGAFRQALNGVAAHVNWASFAIAYLVITTLSNLVESTLFRTGDIQCVMLPMLFAALRGWQTSFAGSHYARALTS